MRNPHTVEPPSLEDRLKAEATRLGFSLSGIAPATEADGFARFQAWLDQGYAGEMDYLHRHSEQRRHPSSILQSVRSVLMLGMEYGAGFGIRDSGFRNEHKESVAFTDSALHSLNPESRIPNPVGQVASYAQGPDYHRFVWDRINSLAAWLEAEVPGCRAKAVADTAPLLERDFARRAGLGWVGKNTMLINPRRGSFFFLAAVLTDRDLKPDPTFATTHCGTCTACLDACPTDAFAQPFVLDASKCISYLTIELRGEMPVELRPKVGDWLYGCDVCQDVCPWNRKPSPGPVAFPHNPEMESLDPVELLGLDADAFRVRFKPTSLWRNRRAGLLRNAAIVLGNIGDKRALPALEKALTDPDAAIRDAATWAIERIHERIGGRKM
ncbi:MAG: tRNA epoxyqueuosine(34) reductase QueG [Planctomycetaceae bacterium]|nr:tRNA epoxyqueuosine(34) reductase QueG [Planctomycetaceae bacterium]